MIYASLKPIPAWRHRLVLPGYLLFALLTGGLPMLLSTWPNAGGMDRGLPWLLVAIVVAALALKLAYWRDIDRSPLPQSRGDAIGLPQRTPSRDSHDVRHCENARHARSGLPRCQNEASRPTATATPA